jgi:hypothetical protein
VVFGNRFADAVGPSGDEPSVDRCECVRRGQYPDGVEFHSEQQDMTAPGWLHLLELIDAAAEDGRRVFKPFVELSAAERRQVSTLPPTIAKLTEVEHLTIYGTNLVRIPPEIGAMTALRVFEPYTSYRLHWFPYELTRCARLVGSTVSTRALYGNYRYRPPFPALGGSADAEATGTCSVCAGPINGRPHQVWISLRVATDVLPLLVNACSAACVAALPKPPRAYLPHPHTGGQDLVQPTERP